jgi:hypothetical protein
MIREEGQGGAAGIAPQGMPAAAIIDRVSMPRGGTLETLAVPLEEAAARDGMLPDDLVARAGAWVAEVASHSEPAVIIPLYGTFVAWAGGRAALIGPTDRLERMRDAVLEFSALAHDLRGCERELTAALAHVDDDAGLAFEFDERAVPRRGELAERFRQAVAIRRRLVGMAPAVHRPAQHPPTLASQIGERLRERTRLADRYEFAGQQAEVLERVYEGCGQRASDFMLARRQMMLEWTIIVLLATETIVLLVDLLASRRG